MLPFFVLMASSSSEKSESENEIRKSDTHFQIFANQNVAKNAHFTKNTHREKRMKTKK